MRGDILVLWMVLSLVLIGGWWSYWEKTHPPRVFFHEVVSYYGMTEEKMECVWSQGQLWATCENVKGEKVTLTLTPNRLRWLESELHKARR